MEILDMPQVRRRRDAATPTCACRVGAQCADTCTLCAAATCWPLMRSASSCPPSGPTQIRVTVSRPSTSRPAHWGWVRSAGTSGRPFFYLHRQVSNTLLAGYRTEHGGGRADGEAYWREACAAGWEGVVAKRAFISACLTSVPPPDDAVQTRDTPGMHACKRRG